MGLFMWKGLGVIRPRAIMVSALILSQCQSAIAQETTVYIDQQFGFRVEYPKDWSVRDTRGTNLRLLVESKNSEDACFFHVSPAPKTQGVSLEKLVSVGMAPGAFEGVMVKQMPRAKVVDIQRSRFVNQEGIVVVFNNVVENVGLLIQQEALVHLRGKMGWHWGGTA